MKNPKTHNFNDSQKINSKKYAGTHLCNPIMVYIVGEKNLW